VGSLDGRVGLSSGVGSGRLCVFSVSDGERKALWMWIQCC